MLLWYTHVLHWPIKIALFKSLKSHQEEDNLLSQNAALANQNIFLQVTEITQIEYQYAFMVYFTGQSKWIFPSHCVTEITPTL